MLGRAVAPTAEHLAPMPNRAVLVRLLLYQATRAETAGDPARALTLYERMTGIDIDVIEEPAEEMAPEDGRLSVIDSLHYTAEPVTAFTRHGLDTFDDLLDQRRSEFMRHV